MLVASPDRTWVADYIAHKCGQVEFWKKSSDPNEVDVLSAVLLLERGQTVAEVGSTTMVGPTTYKAKVRAGDPVEVQEY
jgi:hypothetical protein